MALSEGTRVGPYEIVGPLGVGGMGEVYRARDARLKRDVALKVLPDTFVDDAERLARFQREAELLATLNHPNIAAIYGLETAGGSTAIVMELVEGDTLADRIAVGADGAPGPRGLPLDDALRIARQIVDALEAAHDKGIVHRDLKPANIKIAGDDRVKVLDFGLAKMLESEAPGSSLSMSPTLSVKATFAGVILGTAAYMSPEQARGKPVDRRTDVWAFGCVLFEMLSGRQIFEMAGDTVSDAVAAVLMKEPDWSALPDDTPPHIRTLIRRCLQKDLQKRLPHIGVARIEIDEGPAQPASAAAIAAVPLPPVRPFWKRATPAVAAIAVTAALTSAAWWIATPPPARGAITRFSLPLAEGLNFTNTGRQVIDISRDGTQILYTANQRVYVRSMSDTEARPVPGIDGTDPVINPVFAPDGKSIVFWSGGDQTFKRIAASGGATVTIGRGGIPFGISWMGDAILASEGGKGIVRLSPNGGTVQTIVAVKGDELAHNPQMLPDGDHVLFTLASGVADDRWDKAQIVVQSLKTGERKTLVEGGSDARLLPSGHLVYAFSGVMFAMPFDLRRLQSTGGAVPIVEGVRRAPSAATGAMQAGIASNGSLVYLPGPVSLSAGQNEIALIDRKGTADALKKLPPGPYDSVRLSPDGKRIAFGTDDGKEAAIWVYDLSGATAMKRLTLQGHNRFPVWSADSRHVVFQSDRGGDAGIFWQLADGTAPAERLTTAAKDTSHVPESWSSANQFLYRITGGAKHTLWLFSVNERKSTAFAGIESEVPTDAAFSPDGHWVAYTSGRAGPQPGGARAIFIQPFPATGATYQVPILEPGGYRHAAWSADGKELFFVIGGNVRFRVASVTTRPEFGLGNATQLPRPPFWSDAATDVVRKWDVMPDGEHFIATVRAGQRDASSGVTPQIQVVLNWFEDLKQRVPVK